MLSDAPSSRRSHLSVSKPTRAALRQIAVVGVVLTVLAVELERIQGALASMGIPQAQLVALAFAVLVGIWVTLRAWTTSRRGWSNALETDAPLSAAKTSPHALGVKRSGRAESYRRAGEAFAPYIRRDVHAALVEAMSDDRFVLIDGHRGTGVTATVAGALRDELLAQRTVLICRESTDERTEPFASFLTVRLPRRLRRRPTIVWAGDIGSQLEQGAISVGRIDRFLHRNPHATIVATIGTEQRRILGESTDEALRTPSAVVKSARRDLTVPAYLNGAEIARAAAVFTDMSRAQLRYLVRTLRSPEQVRKRYHEGIESNPLGHAVATAVADYWRATGHRPAPERFVREAVVAYDNPITRLPTAAELRAAIRWATERVGNDVALVDARRARCLRPSPQLVELLHEDREQIPVRVLELVFDNVAEEPASLIALGVTAHGQGELELAERAFRQVDYRADEGHKWIAREHRLQLEQLLEAARRQEPFDRFMRERANASVLRHWLTELSPEPVEERPAPTTSPFDPDVPGPARAGRAASLYRRKPLRAFLRVTSLLAADLMAVLGGLALTLVVKALVRGETLATTFSDFRELVPYALAFALAALIGSKLYVADARRADFLRIVSALVISSALTAAVGWLHGSSLLLSTAAWASLLFAIPLCWGLRARLDHATRRWLWDQGLEQRTLMVGPGAVVVPLARGMLRALGRPSRLVGYVSDEVGDAARERLGPTTRLAQIIERHRVHALVLADPKITPEQALEYLDRCLVAGVDVYWRPSTAETEIYGADAEAGQTVALKRVVPPLLSPAAAARKRLFDLGALLVLAPVAVPLSLLIAALVRLTSRGPVLVRVDRRGRYMRRFTMLKFRTTRVTYPTQSSGLSPAGAPSLDEADVTLVGAVLRHFGLDELPQMINVARGDMSLVGPRPLPDADFAQLSARHRRRYVAKPGITGSWQISGRRGKIDYDETADADLLYIRSWSVKLDVKIALQTIPAMLRGRTDMPSEHP